MPFPVSGISHATTTAPLGAPPLFPNTPVLHPLTPANLHPLSQPQEYTTQELQLSGACDWYKISRLVESESKLIHMLNKAGLTVDASKLEGMRDDVLTHRMANSPFQSAKMFLRNNCANDAYIAKWRHDIDAFARSLKKHVEQSQSPHTRAIDIVYESQLLRQQARVSLPYTGFYNPVPKVPKIPPKTFRDLPYEPRFKPPVPLQNLGLKPLEKPPMKVAVQTASIHPIFLSTPSVQKQHIANFL